MKRPLAQLLDKPMNRREFITTLGLLMILIMGISGTLTSLQSFHKPKKATHGFGSRPYGA